MKFSIVLLIALVSASVVLGDYKHKKSKKFSNHAKKFNLEHFDDDHKEKLFNNFDAVDQMIENHNSNPNAKYRMNHNQFSHMDAKERKKFSGLIVNKNKTQLRGEFIQPTPNYKAPARIDLIEQGWNTPVKDQKCGDCYAFATSSAMEYNIYKRQRQSVVISPQELVDCSGRYGNLGCDGGFFTATLGYIRDNQISTESQYPYGNGRVMACNPKRSNKYGIKSFSRVSQSDNAIMEALDIYGAILIGIDATYLDFYESGVLDQCSTSPTHAVLLVGYGEMNGQKYWKFKNSWGENWGVKGYGYITRDRPNGCGIQSMAAAITA